ncbi:hypothetical protein GGU10DRAFT_27297 [Lentinula aff. detonsa]|uniref:Uncharacterized protein n=1 Tax=Lentinula aff. detonsa TaxID=2804958 RepID=A0AA38KZ02_9AGAR|nr:hypothetical protein GGU10DRAFT_27297 [Lentinula aff. detonsa]
MMVGTRVSALSSCGSPSVPIPPTPRQFTMPRLTSSKSSPTSSAKFGLNHQFNTGIGIPIARQSNDAQGTLTLLFWEMQTSSGNASDKALGFTNKHVVSVDTESDNRQKTIAAPFSAFVTTTIT